MAGDLYYRVIVVAKASKYNLSQNISSLTIKETSGMADELTLNLTDPYKVLSHALREGLSVEVDLGTVEEHSLIFRGKIYKVDGTFSKDKVPTLRLLAHDHSMEMGLRKRSRAWADVKLSDIVKDITSTYFDMNAIVQKIALEGDPKFEGNGIRQHEKTDLQFLNELAKKYGCELFVTPLDKGDQLNFVSQYLIMSEDPDVVLYHGRCGVSDQLLSFQASSSVSNIQLPRVIAGISYDTGKATEQTETEVKEVGSMEDSFEDENIVAFAKENPEKAKQLQVLLSEAGSIQEKVNKQLGKAERQSIPTFTTEEEISALAANQFSTRIHGMRASGSTYGNQYMHAQSAIEIADVGGRFSGIWYLSEVRHLLTKQGYKTEFQCQR